MSEARDRIRRLAGLAPQDPEVLRRELGEPVPRGWNKMGRVEKLDHLADRILASDRTASGVTAHQALKETGILSVWQMDRRRRREVMSPKALYDDDTDTHGDDYADIATTRAGLARTASSSAGVGRSYPRYYQHNFIGYTDMSGGSPYPPGKVRVRRVAPSRVKG